MNNFLNRYINELSEEKIVEVKNGRYQNRLFAISFSVPEDWHIIHSAKFDAIARKQKFKDPMELYKDSLFDALGHPCLVISKYDPDSKDLDGVVSPVINFSICLKESEEPGINLRDYALQIEVGEDESFLKKFKITNIGSVYVKDGYQRIAVDTEYLFEHPELKNSEMVEMKVLNIDYGDYFLDFSMTHCRSQGQIADKEFEDFMKSIILNK